MPEADRERINAILRRIEDHADQIYVRLTLPGAAPVNARLTELPAREALRWVFKWIREDAGIEETNCAKGRE